jgi:Domain of unknown function (DUF3400)
MLIALTTEGLSVCSSSAANVKPRSSGRSQMARHVLGADWLSACVERANRGGIERVLV